LHAARAIVHVMRASVQLPVLASLCLYGRAWLKPLSEEPNPVANPLTIASVQFCKGVIESLGICTFGGELRRFVTAHPKRDPDTGELHHFSYLCAPLSPHMHVCCRHRPLPQMHGVGDHGTKAQEPAAACIAPIAAAPTRASALLTSCLAPCRCEGAPHEWCVYSVTAPDGRTSPPCVVDVQHPQMIHDFAITKNYAVFLDMGLAFNPKVMVKEGGIPFKFDYSKKSRIGLVRKPRGGVYKWPEGATAADAAQVAKGERLSGVERWFEVETFFCFHTAGAWEEDGGNTVCVVLCRCASCVRALLAVRTLHQLHRASHQLHRASPVRIALACSSRAACATFTVTRLPGRALAVHSGGTAAVSRSDAVAHSLGRQSSTGADPLAGMHAPGASPFHLITGGTVCILNKYSTFLKFRLASLLPR
jgi:Retinal pigment epithelial membrane protein